MVTFERNGRARAATPLGTLAVVALLAPASPVAGQQDFSDVEIEATHVAGAVYMLVGRGGNIGVSSGPDGALLVDDQFAPLADRIRAALIEIGREERASDPRFVLNTHFHGDHVGGNIVFGPEATIVAHANVRRRLSTPQERPDGSLTEPLPDEGLPVVTFGDSVSIHFNGEEIRALHPGRGHTDGDAVIFFTGSNVVHMGDDFFAGRYPFVDLAAGGSVQGLERAVAAVLDQLPEDARIIPGHGPLSTVDDLRVYHRMLRESLERVAAARDRGLTVEQVQAEGMPARWEGWGDGFIDTERWLATVYESLDASAGRAGATGSGGAVDAAHGGNYGHRDGKHH